MKTPIIAVAAYHFGKAKPELKQRVFVISSINVPVQRIMESGSVCAT